MTLRVNSNNIQSDTLATISGPRMSNVQITDSSYSVIDDTAVDVAGGYIKITGSNFTSGCQVLIDVTAATAVTFVSSTEVRAQVPAKTAGTYTVYLVNPNGDTAIRVNGLTYSAFPAWSTGSTLPNGSTETLISIQLSAPSNSTVSYALAAGNTLPTGLTLSNVGLLSGTITGLTVETTYNFTVIATDLEYQDTSRAFSITITVGDSYWTYVTTLLSPTLSTLPFNDDASTNNFAVTIAGDTRPYNFNPYTPGYYSATFNGTSGTAIGTFTGPTIGTGDYTIEFWIYHNTLASDQDYYQTYSGTSVNIFLEYDATAGRVRHNLRNDAGTSNFDFNSTVGLVANTWNHLAFVVSGTTAYTFINGNYTTSGATATVTGTRSASYTNTLIGTLYSNTRLLNGYMSNFRFVKGTALYTSNFTPSTSPLTAVANTALLLFQSNRFIDNSTNNYTIPPGSASTISSFTPYTPSSSYSTYGSTYFDGNGDYMAVANNTAFNCGTGDFTLECWFYDDGSSTSYPSIFSSTDWATGTGGVSLRYNNTGAANKFYVAFYASNSTPTGGSGVNELMRTTNTYPTKTWHHVAFVRSSGNVFSLYVNGVRDTTTTSSGITIDWSLNANGPKIGGGNWDGANSYIKGYVSNLRLVKGTALYTGTTYTVPTQPLTAVANTSLLTCQTNQPAANNTFIDNSTSNFAITRNGNTTQGTFSPYSGTWSYLNSGTGNTRLSVANNSALQFGTGDFTVEFWAYITGQHGSDLYTGVLSFGGVYGTANTCLEFTMEPNGGLGVTSYTNTTSNFYINLIAGGSGLLFNTWRHFAISRSGTTIRAFTDGVLKGTVTGNSTNINGTGIGAIMFQRLDSASTSTPGYISNVRALKGTALYTANFTPSSQPLTPITNTSLLTCADNRFVDRSANNFAITRTGDVSVQKFSPFGMQTQIVPTSYSVFFDGTGDYLSFNAVTSPSTGDFTVEFWFYNTRSAWNTAFDITDGGNGAMAIYFDTTSNIRIAPQNQTSTSIASVSSLSLNTWIHFAIIRSSGSLRAYANGAALAAAISYTTSLTGFTKIGGTGDGYALGYISNFRYTTNAVYSIAGSNITVPTSPLQAIAGTSLLACQSATLIDNSTNAFTLTANGDTAPRQFNPLGFTNPTAGAYTTTSLGGSMYFDGTGDWLTVASTSALGFGTGDYNIEFWLYLSASPSSGSKYTLLDFRPASGGNPHTCYVNNSAGTLYLGFFNGTSDVTSSSQPLTVNSWHHCVWARASGTLRIFVNGVQAYSAANSVDYQSARPLNIGASSDTSTREPLTGYISDLRIIKGQALYTSPFVPPAVPVDPVKNTVLLLKGTAAGIYDSAMINNFETVGDVKLSTATVKFAGTTSMYFDGTGDWIHTAPGINFEFGGGDFTVEFWFYTSSTSRQWFIHAATDYWFGIDYNSTGTNKLGLWASSNGTSWNLLNADAGGNGICATTLPQSQWNHIAVTRSGNVWRVFLNGTQDLSVTVSGSIVDRSSQIKVIGSWAASSHQFPVNGYMSDFRVTKGIARYTANFTAPTEASKTR